MMTLSLASSILSLGSLWLKNPVNFGLTILVLSIAVFYSVYMTIGWGFIAMIVTLIFLGGIMMMFMIMASITPNMSIGSFKYPVAMLAMLSLMIFFPLKSSKTFYMLEFKMILQSGFNVIFSMSIILIYFVMFLFLVVDWKTPMRSMCS